MILMGRRRYLSFVFGSALSVAGYAAYFYHRFVVENPSNVEARFTAETLLFIGISLATVIIIGGIAMTSYSRSVDKELDKLGEGSARGQYSASRASRTLGKLGARVNKLVQETTAISDKRRLRMGAQQRLIAMLCGAAESETVLIADIEGQLKYMSDGALDHYGFAVQDILGKSVGDVLGTDFNFETALVRFIRREPFYDETRYEAYAAYDDEGTPHYVLIKLKSEVTAMHRVSGGIAKAFEWMSKR